MSTNEIRRSLLLKDEAKDRSVHRSAEVTAPVKTPSTGAEGLYKTGFPHGLGLLGLKPAALIHSPAAESSFAATGAAVDEICNKGKNLDLYA